MAAVLERFRRRVPNARTRSPANEAGALAAAGTIPNSPPVNGDFNFHSVTPSQSPLHEPLGQSPAHRTADDASSANSSNSFMQKPQRGWLHPDHQLRPGAGVVYGVRYIGSMEVTAPMRTLDFEVRTQVAKESINLVCEAAGLKSINKKRRIERKIQRLLGERPDLHNAGFDVTLTITTDALEIVCTDGDRNGETICHHPMQGVSFASGGDAETLDFVAYVAKDTSYARACHVLECGGGLAQDVLTTIGQAFELRFKEFLQNSPRAADVSQQQQPPPQHHQFQPIQTVSGDSGFVEGGATWGSTGSASLAKHEYYNDIPPSGSPSLRRDDPLTGGVIRGNGNDSSCGILLQDNRPPPPIPPLPRGHLLPATSGLSLPSPTTTTTDSFGSATVVSAATNPFDFFGTLPPPPSTSPPPLNSASQHNSLPIHSPQAQIGCNDAGSTGGAGLPGDSSNGISSNQNSLFSTNQNSPFASSQPPLPPLPLDGEGDVLYHEPWFHGKISRREAEALLTTNGDFLVRESTHQAGQFVLSGLHRGAIKHLLLVDPQGVVRTKDKQFDNVSHLIRFHRDNHVPIVSADSELLLVTPVVKA